MTTESKRNDLYNGLTELLGQDRADTLMAHLPTHQYDDLATREDIESLGDRVDGFESSLSARIDNVESALSARIDNVESALSGRIDDVESTLSVRIDNVDKSLNARFDGVALDLGTRVDSLRAEMAHRFDVVSSRIDRLVLTLAAGLFAIIATMIAQSVF